MMTPQHGEHSAFDLPAKTTKPAKPDNSSPSRQLFAKSPTLRQLFAKSPTLRQVANSSPSRQLFAKSPNPQNSAFDLPAKLKEPCKPAKPTKPTRQV
jgi:hypothetical protein